MKNNYWALKLINTINIEYLDFINLIYIIRYNIYFIYFYTFILFNRQTNESIHNFNLSLNIILKLDKKLITNNFIWNKFISLK
jgi:hypothetical protein